MFTIDLSPRKLDEVSNLSTLNPFYEPRERPHITYCSKGGEGDENSQNCRIYFVLLRYIGREVGGVGYQNPDKK